MHKNKYDSPHTNPKNVNTDCHPKDCYPKDCITKECLEETLEKFLTCTPPIPISDVPFDCNVPGYYCVTNNLDYYGTDSAINIKSSNVTILGSSYELRLLSSGSTGITSRQHDDFTVQDLTISGYECNCFKGVGGRIGIDLVGSYNKDTQCESTCIHLKNLSFKNLLTDIVGRELVNIKIDDICSMTEEAKKKNTVFFYNTGVDINNVVLLPDSQDTHWKWKLGTMEGQAIVKSPLPEPFQECGAFISLPTSQPLVQGDVVKFCTIFDLPLKKCNEDFVVAFEAFCGEGLQLTSAILNSGGGECFEQTLDLSDCKKGFFGGPFKPVTNTLTFCATVTSVDNFCFGLKRLECFEEPSLGTCIDIQFSENVCINNVQSKNKLLAINVSNNKNVFLNKTQLISDDLILQYLKDCIAFAKESIAILASSSINVTINDTESHNYALCLRSLNVKNLTTDTLKAYNDCILESKNTGIESSFSENVILKNTQLYNFLIGIKSDSVINFTSENLEIRDPELLQVNVNNISRTGIDVSSATNVSLKNTQLYNFLIGIEATRATNFTSENLEACNNVLFDSIGIRSLSCQDITLINTQLINFSIGVSSNSSKNFTSENLKARNETLISGSIGIDASSNENVLVKNTQLLNYAVGVNSVNSKNVTSDILEARNEALNVNIISYGIDSTNAENISLKNTQLYNYYIGVITIFSRNFTSENLEVRNDLLDNTTFTIGVNSSNCENVLLKDTQIFNFLAGVNSANTKNFTFDTLEARNTQSFSSSVGVNTTGNENVLLKNGQIFNFLTGVESVGCKIFTSDTLEVRNTQLSINSIGIYLSNSTDIILKNTQLFNFVRGVDSGYCKNITSENLQVYNDSLQNNSVAIVTSETENITLKNTQILNFLLGIESILSKNFTSDILEARIERPFANSVAVNLSNSIDAILKNTQIFNYYKGILGPHDNFIVENSSMFLDTDNLNVDNYGILCSCDNVILKNIQTHKYYSPFYGNFSKNIKCSTFQAFVDPLIPPENSDSQVGFSAENSENVDLSDIELIGFTKGIALDNSKNIDINVAKIKRNNFNAFTPTNNIALSVKNCINFTGTKIKTINYYNSINADGSHNVVIRKSQATADDEFDSEDGIKSASDIQHINFSCEEVQIKGYKNNGINVSGNLNNTENTNISLRDVEIFLGSREVSGLNGVLLDYSHNVSVHNLKVKNYGVGLSVNNSKNIHVEGLNIINTNGLSGTNGISGVQAFFCANAKFSDINIHGYKEGMVLDQSYNILVKDGNLYLTNEIGVARSIGILFYDVLPKPNLIQIENCNIQNFQKGILLQRAVLTKINNVQIFDVSKSNNVEQRGIDIILSEGSSIRNVLINNMFRGIDARASKDLFIENSQFNNTGTAILLGSNSIPENFNHITCGVKIINPKIKNSDYGIITDTGTLGEYISEDIVIKEGQLSNISNIGIYFSGTKNSRIENSSFTKNETAVQLANNVNIVTEGNAILNSNFTGNTETVVLNAGTLDNLVKGNNVFANKVGGGIIDNGSNNQTDNQQFNNNRV